MIEMILAEVSKTVVSSFELPFKAFRETDHMLVARYAIVVWKKDCQHAAHPFVVQKNQDSVGLGTTGTNSYLSSGKDKLLIEMPYSHFLLTTVFSGVLAH